MASAAAANLGSSSSSLKRPGKKPNIIGSLQTPSTLHFPKQSTTYTPSSTTISTPTTKHPKLDTPSPVAPSPKQQQRQWNFLQSAAAMALDAVETALVSHERQHPLPKTADPRVQISGNFAPVPEQPVVQDLPVTGEIPDCIQGALQAGLSYMRGDIGGMAKGLLGLGKKVMNGNKAEQVSRATRTSPADAIQWSGCKDSQTSADAVEAGAATGAMSYAFITALTQNPQQTYQQLLVSIRQILKEKYSQKPQLSASHPIDTNLMFVM